MIAQFQVCSIHALNARATIVITIRHIILRHAALLNDFASVADEPAKLAHRLETNTFRYIDIELYFDTKTATTT